MFWFCSISTALEKFIMSVIAQTDSQRLFGGSRVEIGGDLWFVHSATEKNNLEF